MSQIVFPNLNLSFTVSRIAFSFFGIDVYWYGLLIVSSFVIGLLLCKFDDKKYNISFDSILELFLIMLPMSIVCARLYFVLFKLDYFLSNPGNLFNIHDGGLAIYGGIIGAILAILIYCKFKKLNALDMLDYLAPFLPLGQSIGRWGNFVNVEAYGTQTDSFFKMGIFKSGVYSEVHPAFLYESACTMIIFILLMCIRNKRKYSGQITCMYLFLYSFTRAIIEGLRIDSLMFYNFRVSQLLSVLLSVLFGGILIFNAFKFKKYNKN